MYNCSVPLYIPLFCLFQRTLFRYPSTHFWQTDVKQYEIGNADAEFFKSSEEELWVFWIKIMHSDSIKITNYKLIKCSQIYLKQLQVRNVIIYVLCNLFHRIPQYLG